MKLFNLDLIENLPKLVRKNVDGKRHYLVEGEENFVPLPSVTSVLSVDKESQDALHAWRKRIGTVEANKVSRHAASRGSSVHKLIEDYIQGVPTFESAMPHHKQMFGQLRQVADAHIDNIRMIEGKLFSLHLRVAGTVDMVADFRGKRSIIDWKTSTRVKSREHAVNYFTQEAAYAVMFEERTKLPVSQLVTIMCVEGETTPLVFIEKRDDWISRFIDLRNRFEMLRGM